MVDDPPAISARDRGDAMWMAKPTPSRYGAMCDDGDYKQPAGIRDSRERPATQERRNISMTALEAKADEVRREKARNRRYKKAAVSGLTLFEIQERLEKIGEACDEVAYWTDSDDQTLIDALDVDSDEASKFRFDFADLSAEVDRMLQDIWEIEEPERFDDILVASGLGRQKEMGLFGYDDYEEDYFGLYPFEHRWAEDESVKRLERLTKKELISQMAQSVAIAFSFIGLENRYGDLKASMDILRAQNKEYLDAVKHINEIYDRVNWEFTYSYHKELEEIDAIAERLPQEAFL